MALKIRTAKDGRINPDVMDLLVRFGQHCGLCDHCAAARKSLSVAGQYCATGDCLIRELLDHPDVEYTEETPPGATPL